MAGNAPEAPQAAPAAAQGRTRRDEIAFASLDDVLGPGGSRYFGGGYRRVGYRLGGCGFDPRRRRLEAGVAIDYPGDWSVKAAGHRRPHLSTVDAIVLAARLGGLAVAMVRGSREPDDEAWVRRVDVRAGAAPDEGRLDRLPVVLDHQETVRSGEDTAVSTVVGQVGTMKVRCELVHAARRSGTPADVTTEAARAWSDGPYGDALHAQHQEVSDLRLLRPGLRAEARVDLRVPRPSLVDAFVVSLQLGQVLLYDLDEVERGRSANLWMRSATLTAEQAPGGRPPAHATAALEAPKVLPARGAQWRSATIVADCLGVRTRCAVAHELPTAHAQAARADEATPAAQAA